MLRALASFLILATLPACGQTFAGSTYRIQAGRTVGEFFERGTTAYSATAEFRFDRR